MFQPCRRIGPIWFYNVESVESPRLIESKFLGSPWSQLIAEQRVEKPGLAPSLTKILLDSRVC